MNEVTLSFKTKRNRSDHLQFKKFLQNMVMVPSTRQRDGRAEIQCLADLSTGKLR